MHAGLLLLMLVGQPGRLGAGLEAAPRDHAAAETDPLFFDRLHQKFLLLIETVVPAYEEHFREEPENLATVRQYANRLTELVGSGSPSRAGFSQGPEAAGAAPDEAPDTLMKNALEAIRDGKPDLLENYLARLGSQPHAVLQRQGETAGLATASVTVLTLKTCHAASESVA